MHDKRFWVLPRRLLTDCGYLFAAVPGVRLSSFRQASVHGFRRVGRLPTEHLQQHIHIVIQFGQSVLELGDLPASMQDRRMIAATEIRADFR